jgi:hypothetical protein
MRAFSFPRRSPANHHMKTLLAVIVSICLAAIVWGTVQTHRSAQMRRELSATKLQLKGEALNVQTKQDGIAELQVKLEEVVAALTNSTARLAAAQVQGEDFKRQLDDLRRSEAERAAHAKILAQVPANEVWSINNTILLVNGRYVRRLGTQVLYEKSGEFYSFDVGNLHDAVLARLNIDREKALAEQVAINHENTTQNAIRARNQQILQQQLAERQAEAARIANEQAQQAAFAERQRWEDNLRATAVMIDSIKAQAAMRAADAALMNANNPQPGTVIQNVQQQQQMQTQDPWIYGPTYRVLRQ